MCEITGVTELKSDTLISCTPYDGPFMNSQTLRIFDRDNKLFVTTDFALDRTRPCFNNNTSAPWIMLKIAIPSNFLQKGNRIELV